MAKILNLDSDDDGATEAPNTMEFEWGGHKWHMLTDFNMIAFGEFQGASDDTKMAAFSTFFKTLVVEDERDAWVRFLVERNFKADKLVEKMQQLLAAAGKDDSKSSAASSPTPTRRTSQRRSTVASS